MDREAVSEEYSRAHRKRYENRFYGAICVTLAFGDVYASDWGAKLSNGKVAVLVVAELGAGWFFHRSKVHSQTLNALQEQLYQDQLSQSDLSETGNEEIREIKPPDQAQDPETS